MTAEDVRREQFPISWARKQLISVSQRKRYEMVLVEIDDLPLAHGFSQGVCLIREGGQEVGFVQKLRLILGVAKAVNRGQLCLARRIPPEGQRQQEQPCGHKIEKPGLNR